MRGKPFFWLTSLKLDMLAPSRNLWPDVRGDGRGSEVRVGGMLGGKAGLCYCHIGTSASRLDPLRAALAAASDLPRSAQLPVSLHLVSAAICEPCSEILHVHLSTDPHPSSAWVCFCCYCHMGVAAS